jgi:hypothetical protein
MPAEPGTKVVNETEAEREIDGIVITETIIEWNDTDGISADYVTAGGINLYADRESLTSFDEPLSDDELRDVLAEYTALPVA